MAGNLALGKTSHDLIIGRGATRTSGVEQVAQLVKCRLLTITGEWEFDKSLGLPWFEAILAKRVRPSDIQSAIANIIRRTNGVRQLISIEIIPDFRERTLTINFQAYSNYGKISDEVSWQ